MKIPFLWCPPECLPTNIWDKSVKVYNPVFNEKSDIWAFGVVLWEIASYGLQPYGSSKGLVKLLQKIENGLRLEFPEGCPTKLKELAQLVFALVPEDRPSFEVVKEELLKILEPMKHKIRDVGGLLNAPLEERLREMSTRATLVRRKSLGNLLGGTPSRALSGLATLGETEEPPEEKEEEEEVLPVALSRRPSQIDLDDPNASALSPQGLFHAKDWEMSPAKGGRPSLRRRRSRPSLGTMSAPELSGVLSSPVAEEPAAEESGVDGVDGADSAAVDLPRPRVASTHEDGNRDEGSGSNSVENVAADLLQASADHRITRKISSEFYAPSDSDGEGNDDGMQPLVGEEADVAGVNAAAARSCPSEDLSNGNGDDEGKEEEQDTSGPALKRDSFAILSLALAGESNVDVEEPAASLREEGERRSGEVKGTPAEEGDAEKEGAAGTISGESVEESNRVPALISAEVAPSADGGSPARASSVVSSASAQDLAFLMADLKATPLEAQLTPTRPGADQSRRASTWDHAEVTQFLSSNSLGKWAASFEVAGINGSKLMEMTPAVLVTLGVNEVETRGLMMRLIRQIRAEDSGILSEQSPAPTVATPVRERERRTSVQRRRERRMNRLAGDLDWEIDNTDEAAA